MQGDSVKGEGKKLSYIECDKSGFHYGEVLNMVCVEPSCLQDLVCCCACIQQTHKKHSTKPLKMVLKEARTHSDKIKPTVFNIDVIINIMLSSQKKTLEDFATYRKEIVDNLDQVEKSLVSYYSSIVEQIKVKNSDPLVEIKLAEQTVYNCGKIDDFKVAVKKLVSMIPSKDEPVLDMSEADLIDSITASNDEIFITLNKNAEDLLKKSIECNQILNKQINAKSIWKKSLFKFSPTLKHNDVKVLSDYIVKSGNSSGYKFALMEPCLEKGSKIKTFSFKIKESTSNWVAVGMCHQKIVKNKSYAFNFNSLGHGGYMISANGGSWSNSKTEANNTVKALKFGKGDIITCTVNLETKKLSFKKKAETYELNFETIKGDELYPCALFYYINDEVEFLPSFKAE